MIADTYTINTENLILATDSYKLNHWNQYPKDIEAVYSYFESRPGAKYDYTLFFGLQYLLKKHLVGHVVRHQDLETATELARAHFGQTGLFNYQGWAHIINDHAGKLPLKIKAVPEGTKVPVDNVMMTVENTCPKCFWLTNALESLLVHVWYTSTVATLSHNTLDMIGDYLDKTGCGREGLPFMLHDFGYRGASSHETAAVGGMAHLVNSLGTDTLPAMLMAMEYYKADLEGLAYSVPATEHSVMTAKGREGEMEVLKQLLDEYPEGILSVVSDSYNVENFIDKAYMGFGTQIMERDGKLVFRPDSLRNDDDTPERQILALSHKLFNLFGGTMNEAGYKVLDPHVGLLWGDGIGPEGIDRILAYCAEEGFAASNYVFGMGGGLLQKVNRDTQRFAFKCSAQKRNGEWVDVSKGANGKKSKAGRLQLILPGYTLEAKPEGWTPPGPVTMTEDPGVEHQNLLETVFEDGELVREQTFADIRERATM